MNYYELHRNFWDFCYANPDRVRPNHGALFAFCIDLNNRLGWREKFSLPTTMAKDAIGIRSYNTYIKTLNDLVDWGFIKIHERSKNQYTANIIGLSKNDKANNKALDKAIMNHNTKQGESNEQSIGSIDKQEYNTTIQSVNNVLLKKEPKGKFDFENSFLSLGVTPQHLRDWMDARREKKMANTESVFEEIISEINKSGYSPAECISFVAGKSWAGFEAAYMPTRSIAANRTVPVDTQADKNSAEQAQRFRAAAIAIYQQCLADNSEWIGDVFSARVIERIVIDRFTIGEKNDIIALGEKEHRENRTKYYGLDYAIGVAYVNAALAKRIEIKTESNK